MPRKRFEISTGVKTSADVFIVEAKAGSLRGIGSGSPSSIVNDNPIKCKDALAEECALEVELQDYFDDQIAFVVRDKSPSAAAAIDIAVWDLFAKEYGVSLCSLIGLTGHEVETGATVDVKPPSEAAAEARRLVSQGFKKLKIKVGTSVLQDVERVKAVREASGDDVKIFADANGGYDYRAAAEFWEKSEPFNIEFFEQPLPADRLADMARLRREYGVRICGDESVRDETSLREVLACEAVDMINIKLMKCGGLTPAIEMIKIARDGGLGVMIGCMSDIGISIAAAAHLSIGKEVELAELDSHLNIEPICDGPVVEGGILRIPSGPGIGIGLRNGWQRWIV